MEMYNDLSMPFSAYVWATSNCRFYSLTRDKAGIMPRFKNQDLSLFFKKIEKHKTKKRQYRQILLPVLPLSFRRRHWRLKR
tara:strand:+ start:10155 stop:10397 length:243 start_codon:yes stop_codon:yes gene_type:complete